MTVWSVSHSDYRDILRIVLLSIIVGLMMNSEAAIWPIQSLIAIASQRPLSSGKMGILRHVSGADAFYAVPNSSAGPAIAGLLNTSHGLFGHGIVFTRNKHLIEDHIIQDPDIAENVEGTGVCIAGLQPLPHSAGMGAPASGRRLNSHHCCASNRLLPTV